MRHKNKIRLIEFLIIGIVFGIAEDLFAIIMATGKEFEWRYLLVATLAALPFAFISEIIVDHPNFWKVFLPKKWFEDKNDDNKDNI